MSSDSQKTASDFLPILRSLTYNLVTQKLDLLEKIGLCSAVGLKERLDEYPVEIVYPPEWEFYRAVLYTESLRGMPKPMSILFGSQELNIAKHLKQPNSIPIEDMLTKVELNEGDTWMFEMCTWTHDEFGVNEGDLAF